MLSVPSVVNLLFFIFVVELLSLANDLNDGISEHPEIIEMFLKYRNDYGLIHFVVMVHEDISEFGHFGQGLNEGLVEIPVF